MDFGPGRESTRLRNRRPRLVLLWTRGYAAIRPLLAIFAIAFAATSGAAQPSVSIHLVPADEPMCEITGEDLRCATLNATGDPSVPQLAYIIISGFEEMSSFQFGIGFDPTVRLGKWMPCVHGIEVATAGWPRRSGAGVGIRWRHCLEPLGVDGLFVVGVIEVEPWSWGRLWIETYNPVLGQDTEIETCGTPSEQIEIFGTSRMGIVRVHGAHPPRSVCQERDPAERAAAD